MEPRQVWWLIKGGLLLQACRVGKLYWRIHKEHFQKYAFRMCQVLSLGSSIAQSVVVSRLWAAGSGVRFRSDAIEICLLRNVWTGSKVHPTSMLSWVIFQGEKRPGCEVGHWPSCSAQCVSVCLHKHSRKVRRFFLMKFRRRKFQYNSQTNYVFVKMWPKDWALYCYISSTSQ